MVNNKSDANKKMVSVTMDATVHETAKALIAVKCPGESFSSHVQKLVKEDNAKLAGLESQVNIDVALLQKNLRQYSKRQLDVKQLLEKLGALDRVEDLVSDCGLKKDYSNAEDVIRKLLDSEDQHVKAFLEGEGSERDLQLLINLVEVNLDLSKVKKQLMEAKKKQYLKKN